jgi:hypothetical protein
MRLWPRRKMNKFKPHASNRVEGNMDEMIVIRALEDGVWEIRVEMMKNEDEIIIRGKQCRI